MDDWSASIKFGAICDLFECLSKDMKREKKTKKLDDFLRECRKHCPKECDLFPIVRLLVPKLDSERGSYGIKETVFAKVSIFVIFSFFMR